MKLITVIPVFNCERYIGGAIHAAVWAQGPRKPDELIVLDNASTDGTGATISLHVNEFQSPPDGYPEMRWIRNETNIGMVENFNKALDLACERADYVHLLMADDLILPNFYERAISAMEGVEGRAMAYSLYDFIDADGKVTHRGNFQFGPGDGRTCQVRKDEFIGRHAELKTVSLPGVLLKTNRHPPACYFRNYSQVTDIMFNAEWASHSTAIFEISEVLCHQRMHPTNSTSRNIQNIDAWCLDEWRVMQRISGGLLNGGPVNEFIRSERLSCIFAARSIDKADRVRRGNPDYAAQIERESRRCVKVRHWLAGKAAVVARDIFKRNSP